MVKKYSKIRDISEINEVMKATDTETIYIFSLEDAGPVYLIFQCPCGKCKELLYLAIKDALEGYTGISWEFVRPTLGLITINPAVLSKRCGSNFSIVNNEVIWV